MQKVIAVLGPTASGKTGLSVALAKHYGAEIVSVDSMQIYDEMNIGTAKPSMDEREGILHHLMGHISVSQSYNVASFKKDAQAVMNEMAERNVLPILCGGTGLYLDHLLENTEFFEIPFDAEVRERYQKMAKEQGAQSVYDLLGKIDPVLAEKLHPNDLKRVIRGLEVYEITNRRLSDFQKESRHRSPFEVLYIGLNFKDRSLLYDRINLRVDQMVEKGLIEEVRNLMENYQLSDTARAGIGYKELIDAIESGGDIELALDLIKQKSRNYAKRQLTWFGRNKDVHWFYRDQMSDEALLQNAIDLADKFLKGGNE